MVRYIHRERRGDKRTETEKQREREREEKMVRGTFQGDNLILELKLLVGKDLSGFPHNE